MEYRVISPVRVSLPRKRGPDKVIALNLNVYRNLHYQILNDLKEQYTLGMAEAISALPVMAEISQVTYLVHLKTRRRFDPPNVGAIVSKFFMDALVYYGKIQDDNWKVAPRHVSDFGGFGEDYCEIIIEGKPMKVSTKSYVDFELAELQELLTAKIKAELNVEPKDLKVECDADGVHVSFVTGSEPKKEAQAQAVKTAPIQSKLAQRKNLVRNAEPDIVNKEPEPEKAEEAPAEDDGDTPPFDVSDAAPPNEDKQEAKQSSGDAQNTVYSSIFGRHSLNRR